MTIRFQADADFNQIMLLATIQRPLPNVIVGANGWLGRQPPTRVRLVQSNSAQSPVF